MTLPVYRLRRVLAATAILLTAAVIGMYIYARMRTRDVRKQVPNKLGFEIKQTANGFQFSKSERGRTLFSVQASDVKEFKLNGRAELHNVSIILYGRDASRYDRITGDDFAYDPKTGDVSAKGEVQIDLVANPEGASGPDQSAPVTIKHAIHLHTRDLVFNRETGNAFTQDRVEFSTPQASGSAVGVTYAGRSNTLTLASQIHVTVSGRNAAAIDAEHGVITSDPRQVILDHPHLDRQGGMIEADRAVFDLTPDDDVQSIVATGNVTVLARYASRKSREAPRSEVRSHADRADLLMADDNVLRTMTLSGNVHVEQSGPRPMQGDAGRMILAFAGENDLQSVRATDGARLEQIASSGESNGHTTPQNFELTAPTIDFAIAEGKVLERAETSGEAKITIAAAETQGPSTPQDCPQNGQSCSGRDDKGGGSMNVLRSGRDDKGGGARDEKYKGKDKSGTTVITAGKFVAKFASRDGTVYPTTLDGAPDARIVNTIHGEPERVSTSDTVEAVFLQQGGIESVTQTGNVVYSDNQPPEKRMQAWATNASYTPADHMLLLSGSPRVTSGSMETTAQTIRINRTTGEAVAENNVKSTYSDLKERPDGALLASASPIHATAHSMVAQSSPGVAVYNGNARLWQDANVIEAPTIQFDRNRRFVTAQGTTGHPVQTILVQESKVQEGKAPGNKEDEKSSSKKKGAKGSALGKSSPITITARQLTYADAERKIHYEDGVQAKGEDFTASSKTLDAYLRPRGQTTSGQAVSGPGQLDHMVAEGDVLIQEPDRRAEGQKLVYTAAEDKFVLTGGPPSIFDAEQGKITGVSLTFFRGDDRVLVEGEASTPVVTRTRVAH